MFLNITNVNLPSPYTSLHLIMLFAKEIGFGYYHSQLCIKGSIMPEIEKTISSVGTNACISNVPMAT